MKTLKFAFNLVPLVLDGSKTATWRLFDDKDLQIDDHIQLIKAEDGKEFAKAQIIQVKTKKLGDIADSDFAGHETFKNRDEMLKTYQGYYGDKVSWDTEVKMIDFKIL